MDFYINTICVFNNSSKTTGRRYTMATTGKKKKKIPPIDQEFLNKMEASLSVLRNEIVDNLVSSNQDFKEIMEGMDSKDLVDVASDDIDRKMIEAIGSQELKRLKLIESALTRIKQGKYGHCIKCSKRIPQERLVAIPYALMCIECKSEEERRNR
jgi:RNA polymerase-binding protein DksA